MPERIYDKKDRAFVARRGRPALTPAGGVIMTCGVLFQSRLGQEEPPEKEEQAAAEQVKKEEGGSEERHNP